MDALVAEGLVERRHGSGTYVVPRPFARVLGLTSFTQDMAARGLVAGSRVVEFEHVSADATVAERLHVAVGDPVIRFTRLRFGSGDAMAVETTWIASTLVPGLTADDLDGSLYELLARRYRIVPGAARITIEPVNPDPETRRPAHDPRGPGVPPAADGGRRRPRPDHHGRELRLPRRQVPADGRHHAAPRSRPVAASAGRVMARVLAVDGGQSAIRVRHSDGDAVVETRA